jgi:peptide/nickel transport system substrate-binding protein
MHSRKLAAGLIVALQVIVACGGDDSVTTSSMATSLPARPPSSGAADSQPPPDAPADGLGAVRFAFNSELTVGFDPHKVSNIFQGMVYLLPVYDRLVKLSGANEIEPMLAEEWEFSDDGLTLTMRLREGVVFHDGATFDAAAAAASLTRALTLEGSSAAGLLASISSAEAVDANTLELTLTRADQTVMFALATIAGAMISPDALDSGVDLSLEPAGSGPYTLGTAGPQGADYARFGDYYDETAAKVERLEIVAIPDSTARLNALASGQVDAGLYSAEKYPEIEALAADGFNVFEILSYNSAPLYLNTAIEPLDDPLVRRAINHAIDRQAISDAIMAGRCIPTSQIIPPGAVGHLDELEPFTYDPEEAQRLLDEAGVGPFTISAISTTVEPYATFATIIKEQLAQIGITIEYRVEPNTSARQVWRTGEYGAMAFAASVISPDPAGIIDSLLLGPDNPAGAADDVAAAAEAARLTALGTDERRRAYEEIGRTEYETPTHVPVCFSPNIVVARPGITGADALPYTSGAAFMDVTGLGIED